MRTNPDEVFQTEKTITQRNDDLTEPDPRCPYHKQIQILFHNRPICTLNYDFQFW